jgi:hypothetical protein
LLPAEFFEGCEARICAAQGGATFDDVGEVAVDADLVAAPSSFLEADRKAFYAIRGAKYLFEDNPLRRGCWVGALIGDVSCGIPMSRAAQHFRHR